MSFGVEKCDHDRPEVLAEENGGGFKADYCEVFVGSSEKNIHRKILLSLAIAVFASTIPRCLSVGASGLLTPFYLPVVQLSFLLEGGLSSSLKAWILVYDTILVGSFSLALYFCKRWLTTICTIYLLTLILVILAVEIVSAHMPNS